MKNQYSHTFFLVKRILLTSYLLVSIFAIGKTQSFEGKITISFFMDKIDPILQEKSDLAFGLDFYLKKDSSINHYIIKGDKLSGTRIYKNGEIGEKTQQKGDSSYIIFESGNTVKYSSLPMKGMDNLRLVKKHKKYKTILGFKCRKYEYDTGGESDTRIIGWIAENFPFDKKKQSHKSFNRIFLPHGLALEKRIIWRYQENLFQVIRIEHYEVEDEVFDFKIRSKE